MKTSIKILRTQTTVLIAVVLMLSSLGLNASSHREAPLTSQDPTIDSTDVYAFRSPDDPTKVTLIANWIPFEEPAGGPNFYHFSDSARYLINIDRDGNGVADLIYEWTFQEQIIDPTTFLYNKGPLTSITDPDFNYRQRYTIATIVGATRTVLGSSLLLMPPDNIGPRSTPDYPTLAVQGTYDLGSGRRVFTGQRDDPFFIDLGSIFDLLGLRPFNAAHLIPLPAAAGIDTPGGFNIHTTAIQVPIADLAPTCPLNASGIPTNPADVRCVIGVWTTAERREFTDITPGGEVASGNFVQVSRLGNPLINELLVDLARKDIFSSLPPTSDAAVLDRVLDPELARLIDALYPAITVPPPPRNDLVTVFLTGIPGLNQQQNSVATPSEQLRLNVAIAPTAGVCSGNPLGFIAGDRAGFPNGRRLEDDVVDIELRAVAGGYAFTPAFNIAPNNQLGDGVNANDRPCLQRFPYMATPHQGYDHAHHLTGAATTPATAGDVLSLNKSVSPSSVTAGGTLTFTLTVTNTSAAAATGVVVTDNLPSNVTFVSATPSQGTCSGTTSVICNVGTLAAGASATVTITATANNSNAVINTATVGGGQADSVTANNTATATAPGTGPNPILSFGAATVAINIGSTGTATVTISAPQATDTVILLTSANTGVAIVPIAVVIPAGQTSAQVNITGLSPGTSLITATLPVTLGGGTATTSAVIGQVAPIPTLDPIAFGILAAMLALVGAFALRRG